MPLHSIRVVGSSAGGKAMGILFARQVRQPAWPSDLSDCGHDRDIAHRRESGMGEIVEGVIHGKTIELAVDPGLQDGGVVEVVTRESNNRERGALLIFFLEIPDTPIKA
ncbi:MAG: hypothetical protein ACLQU5_31565 [Isosphaeraceae bacterium]